MEKNLTLTQKDKNHLIVLDLFQDLSDFYEKFDEIISKSYPIKTRNLLLKEVRGGNSLMQTFYEIMKRHAKRMWFQEERIKKDLVSILEPVETMQIIKDDILHNRLISDIHLLKQKIVDTMTAYTIGLDEYNFYKTAEDTGITVKEFHTYEKEQDKLYQKNWAKKLENKFGEILEIFKDITSKLDGGKYDN